MIFEPEEGRYSFELFDRFLTLCSEEGIRVILGTPTATPPAWLTEKYLEALNALPDGTLLHHGARRHYNYNSPVYRRLCSRIVEQLAQHYGQHPAVVGWQIDNELNCETGEFHSEADHIAFRSFLRKKYGTLDALNAAWGTAVWSQSYTVWDQIYTPRPVLNDGHNPHLLLDYYRFISDSCISFASMQAEIIRKYQKPGDFITTNGLFGNLDNHTLTRDVLDVYTYDSYPYFALGLDRNPKTSTDLNDRKWTRNLIETRSICPHFGIMEQQSGAGGWVNRMEMPAPRPGQVTLWAMQFCRPSEPRSGRSGRCRNILNTEKRSRYLLIPAPVFSACISKTLRPSHQRIMPDIFRYITAHALRHTSVLLHLCKNNRLQLLHTHLFIGYILNLRNGNDVA